jgi:hypothetical protein
MREQFGDALHGPGVVFVPQRTEEALPECLFPANLSGPSAQLGGLGLQPHSGGLPEHFIELGRCQIAERSGASAHQQAGNFFRRLAADPGTEFVDGRIEQRTDGKRGEARINFRFGFPDHVQRYVAESGIAIVSVRPPAAGMQIDFHIAALRGRRVKLQNGIPEIGAAFVIPKAGMKNADGSSV